MTVRLLLILLLLIPHAAWANCTGPAAAIGSLKWLSTAFKYCDGTSWQSFGGGSPGGSNAQVQFNSSGVFSGDSGFTYAGSGGVTITGAASNALSATTSSSSGTAVFGNAGATTGSTYGGYFMNASTSGRAVFGYAGASTGQTYGGSFQNASTSGRAVYGNAGATTGSTYGGYFENFSTDGRAVYGVAAAATGSTYGGYFYSAGTSGTAVYGGAVATTGQTYGGSFQSNSTGGISLYAVAGNAATKGLVVRGAASQTGNLAEFQHFSGTALTRIAASGKITATGSDTIQMSVTNSSTTNGAYGILASVTGTSNPLNIGVAGSAAGTSGQGVLGLATSATGTTYGGWFQSDSTSGRGIFAYASTATGSTYAGYFQNQSAAGISVFSLAGNAATKGLVVRGAASQTGNLAEFQNNGGTALTVVNANGGIGIGTTIPSAQLHISLAGQSTLMMSDTTGASGQKNIRWAYDGGSSVTGGGLVLQDMTDASAFGANRVTFFKNGSVNFGGVTAPGSAGQVIFTSGNVGIGTTNPTSPLHVHGGTVINTCFYAMAYSGTQGPMCQNAGTAAGGNGNGLVSIQAAYAIVAGEFDAYSDYRKKTDIDAIRPEEGLAFVEKVKPVHFRWKDAGREGEKSHGYIAQQLVTAGFGSMVGLSKDDTMKAEKVKTVDGYVDSPAGATFGANYLAAIPYLHAGLEGILKKIRQLKAENDNLRRDFEAYKAAHH